MSYWGWKPYVSVAERRREAERVAAKAGKNGAPLSPVAPYRGAVAKTFWGKAWCDNLERYSDYANRLPRGRTYVRNGSVIDLQIAAGEVRAQVVGSSLYRVKVSVAAVPAKRWQAIGAECAASIDSLVELLQGRLSQSVMQRICRAGDGLFPAPKEIKFGCTCPDWAGMCKHVAAALYGVGARLDQQPELLFRLRRVDAQDLVARADAGLPRRKKEASADKVLADSALAEVFGIEMADIAPTAVPAKAAARRTKPAPTAASKSLAGPKSTPSARRSAGKPGANGKAMRGAAKPTPATVTSRVARSPAGKPAGGKATALKAKATKGKPARGKQ